MKLKLKISTNGLNMQSGDEGWMRVTVFKTAYPIYSGIMYQKVGLQSLTTYNSAFTAPAIEALPSYNWQTSVYSAETSSGNVQALNVGDTGQGITVNGMWNPILFNGQYLVAKDPFSDSIARTIDCNAWQSQYPAQTVTQIGSVTKPDLL